MRTEVFWARVAELGLEDAIPAMKVRGVTAFAKFAIGSDYTPQQPDMTVLATQLLKPLAGNNTDLIPMLRMLWWESWGIATADMKRSAEGTETDAPRKLGQAELTARREEVTSKLGG